MPETNRPAELVYGVVREPPAPFYGHQQVVVQLLQILKTHVDARGLGIVCVSPLDVVLDEQEALVVQPDVIYVATGRTSIIRDQVWGAPDLVVEVMSPSSEYRDRTTKLAWYRRYGVRECWIVNPHTRMIEIVECASGQVESFAGMQAVRSHLLPDLTIRAEDCFGSS
jgi:Uma2 family endonuclease